MIEELSGLNPRKDWRLEKTVLGSIPPNTLFLIQFKSWVAILARKLVAAVATLKVADKGLVDPNKLFRLARNCAGVSPLRILFLIQSLSWVAILVRNAWAAVVKLNPAASGLADPNMVVRLFRKAVGVIPFRTLVVIQLSSWRLMLVKKLLPA